MTVPTPPFIIELEFVRAAEAGDPYAFRFSPQDYLLRSAGGGFENARFSWDESLLADLQAVRRSGRDPVLRQRLGETLRRNPIPALRVLRVEESEAEVILTGAVASYYLKQLAQEAVLPLIGQRLLHNRVAVLRDR